MIVRITVSSLIAVAVVGYALLKALSRPNVNNPLKLHGLKIYFED